ncbi:MAG: WD40 repeat domain-containing protein, partial [Chloroflexota bacterium]
GKFGYLSNQQQVISIGIDGHLNLWDLVSSDSFFKSDNLFLSEEDARQMGINPSGTFLARAGSIASNYQFDGQYIWVHPTLGLDQESPYQQIKGDASLNHEVAVSAGGNLIAAGTFGGEIYVYNRSDPNPETSPLRLDGHWSTVGQLAFSPVEDRLASVSRDGTIRLWDLTQPGVVPESIILHSHYWPTAAVTFSPGGDQLYALSSDGHIWQWRLDKATPTLEKELQILAETNFFKAAFSPDGAYLATTFLDGQLLLFDLTSERVASDPPISLKGHESMVQEIVFSPDGRSLASGAEDGTIRIWELASSGPPYLLEGHSNQVISMAYAPDGETLYSLGFGDGVRVWSTTKGVAEGICERVKRNMTWPEWETFLPGRPYEKTCENRPVHCSVPESEWPREYRAEIDQCPAEVLVDTFDERSYPAPPTPTPTSTPLPTPTITPLPKGYPGK